MPSRMSASISPRPERCHISHSAASARAAAAASPPCSAFRPSSSVTARSPSRRVSRESPHGAPTLRRAGPKSKMAPDMARFTGKVVLITGGAGGIGRAAAVRFASEGAGVVLVDMAAANLRQSVAAVEKVDGEVHAVEADVTRIADVEKYVDAAVKRFGGVDVFCNNAGVLGALKPLVDYPEETFDRVIAVNVKAVWLGMKVVTPLLRARGGGAIVNTASIAGLRGSPNIIAYTASKHAVVGMTRAASLELARHNIRVNAVCPAPIETPMAQELETEIKRERLTATIPMRRYGEPQEVAALVAFLASTDAAYITGGIYPVDGGAMACSPRSPAPAASSARRWSRPSAPAGIAQSLSCVARRAPAKTRLAGIPPPARSRRPRRHSTRSSTSPARASWVSGGRPQRSSASARAAP